MKNLHRAQKMSSLDMLPLIIPYACWVLCVYMCVYIHMCMYVYIKTK